MLRQDHQFSKILAANFVSQAGSHFLTLALSSFVYVRSGSAVQAALIFVFSFLPSVFVSAKLGAWIDTSLSRWLLARNELLSALITGLCALILSLQAPLALLCVVLAVRSLLMFVGRTSSLKWIKSSSPGHLLAKRVQLYYLAFFLSTAVSGVLAGVALSSLSIVLIASLDILSYAVSILLIATLKPLPRPSLMTAVQVPPPATLKETLAEIMVIPDLKRSFLFVVFSQTVFQGAYSALISFLPISHLKVGLPGVSWFQVAASMGIIGGFVLNWRSPNTLQRVLPSSGMKADAAPALAAGLALLLLSFSNQMTASLGLFLVMNLFYEWIWLFHSSEFFKSAPTHQAARFQFVLSTSASFLMALMTLAYAGLIQAQGMASGTLLFLATNLTLIAGVSLLSGRAFVPTAASGRFQ